MKTCTSCKKVKNKSEFSKKADRKDGLQSTCKTCNSIASKRYYAKNKTKHKKTVKDRRKRYTEECRKWIKQYLLEHPCIDCGESNPVVLEFDHVRGIKLENVSRMIGHNFSLSSVKNEVAKCDIRCANCHRKKTAKEQGWWINKVGA